MAELFDFEEDEEGRADWFSAVLSLRSDFALSLRESVPTSDTLRWKFILIRAMNFKRNSHHYVLFWLNSRINDILIVDQ